MMNRETANGGVDVLRALGFKARKRSASADSHWIELLSADERRVIRTFEASHVLARYLRLPNRDFATHAATINAERAAIAEAQTLGDAELLRRDRVRRAPGNRYQADA